MNEAYLRRPQRGLRGEKNRCSPTGQVGTLFMKHKLMTFIKKEKCVSFLSWELHVGPCPVDVLKTCQRKHEIPYPSITFKGKRLGKNSMRIG